MKKLCLLLFTLWFLAGIILADEKVEAVSRSSVTEDLTRGQQLVEQFQLTEILGPLAPIALSPYFGLMCLSGAALLVQEGLLPENRFLSSSDILGQESIFAVFLLLTLFTSLPRFTKVSKTLAQAADQLETYSSIVAFALIYYISQQNGASTSLVDPHLVHAGIFSTSKEVLIMAAIAINIIVINTVKFFFEMLVFISPIPAIDACFECLNKAFAAGLMALYIFSPMLATGVNVLIFFVCLTLFRWVHRRVVYFRSLLIGLFWKAKELPSANRFLEKTEDRTFVLPVFLKRPAIGFKKCSRYHLIVDRKGVSLEDSRWMRTAVRKQFSSPNAGVSLESGILQHTISFGAEEVVVTFTRHYDPFIQRIGELLQAESKVKAQASLRTSLMEKSQLKKEFS